MNSDERGKGARARPENFHPPSSCRRILIPRGTRDNEPAATTTFPLESSHESRPSFPVTKGRHRIYPSFNFRRTCVCVCVCARATLRETGRIESMKVYRGEPQDLPFLAPLSRKQWSFSVRDPVEI